MHSSCPCALCNGQRLYLCPWRITIRVQGRTGAGGAGGAAYARGSGLTGALARASVDSSCCRSVRSVLSTLCKALKPQSLCQMARSTCSSACHTMASRSPAAPARASDCLLATVCHWAAGCQLGMLPAGESNDETSGAVLLLLSVWWYSRGPAAWIKGD